jgi:hypothetical protein
MSVSAPFAAAAQAPVVRPVLLVALDYASGMQRLCTAPFAITAMGQEWAGVGHLGGVEPVTDQPGTGARPLVLSLSGIDPADIATALTETYRGRLGEVYLALLDEDHQPIDTPMLIYRGRMDTQQIKLGAEAVISLTLNNRAADWDRPKAWRYTDAAQQARYPGDLGLAFVAQMVDKEITWGRG